MQSGHQLGLPGHEYRFYTNHKGTDHCWSGHTCNYQPSSQLPIYLECIAHHSEQFQLSMNYVPICIHTRYKFSGRKSSTIFLRKTLRLHCIQKLSDWCRPDCTSLIRWVTFEGHYMTWTADHFQQTLTIIVIWLLISCSHSLVLLANTGMILIQQKMAYRQSPLKYLFSGTQWQKPERDGKMSSGGGGEHGKNLDAAPVFIGEEAEENICVFLPEHHLFSYIHYKLSNYTSQQGVGNSIHVTAAAWSRSYFHIIHMSR